MQVQTMKQVVIVLNKEGGGVARVFVVVGEGE